MNHWAFYFSEVGRSSFASKIAHQELNFQAFFDFQPSLAGIEEAKKNKVFTKHQREVLVQTLEKQYANWELPLSDSGIKLKEENTFTVTTGHQLNLLSGPHFFFTKIASTIHLSRLVGSNCIPVFWMATEDHDFEEIASTVLFGKKIEIPPVGHSGPVGRMLMNEDWMNEVNKALELIQSDWSKKIILDAYQMCFSMSKCIARLVHACFGKFGLIIIDGDDPTFKSEVFPLFEKEFSEGILAKQVGIQNEVLANHQIQQQVYNREVNLFSLNDLERKRIKKNDPGFSKLGPHEISPNALMRPIYQELILPNLAYIGGAAEVAYWAQLKNAFAAFEVQMPVVLLRPSVLYLERKQLQWLENWGWNLQDFFLDENALMKKFIQQQSNPFDIAPFLINLTKMEENAVPFIRSIDPTLVSSLSAEVEKMKGMWKGLEKKAEKAIKQKHDVEIQRIAKIKNALFPNQVFQERMANGFQFIQTQEQIETLVDYCSPIQPQIHAFLF